MHSILSVPPQRRPFEFFSQTHSNLEEESILQLLSTLLIMAAAALIVVATIFVGFLFLIQHFSKKIKLQQAIKNLPGPKPLPIIGNALIFTGNVSDICIKLMSIVDTYPSLCRVWLASRLFIVVYDPAHLKTVYTSSSAIHKSEDYNYMKPFVGDGLLSAPAPKWRVARKLLVQAFHLNSLKTFVDVFAKHSNIFIKRLEAKNGEEIEIYDYIVSCALDIIYDTTMGVELDTQTAADCKLPSCMKRMLEIITIRIFKLWLHPDIIFFNSAIGKEQKMCSDYINNFTDKIIEKQKNALETNNARKTSGESDETEKNSKLFIDLVVELAKNGEEISEKDIRDEINTMTIAGTDTTTCTLTFLFLMLASNPEIQDKVYQELYEIYGSSDPLEVSIKYDDLQRMMYIERVIKETMRLFPVAPLVIRNIVEDIHVQNDMMIPKGSSAILAIYKIHRHKKYWTEPMKFDPDRFLPENITERHPFSYIPFSGGPRNCIGAKYATVEMKTIVATTLRKFSITVDNVVPVEDIELKLHIALKPVKPIMLRFTKRF